MAVFKCKMCGGTVEFEPGATVGVCDSCGTKQTLPRLDDDRRANLYDRANHFRRNNDFDKAAGLYEQILNEDSADAEAYWSLVLCRYGIEYVEDPATHKRVPTVNRAQFTSVFDDDNYKSAIRYADIAQRQLYEEEARTINEIQKGILSISQKEEPFDVFICYKETDANGHRTPDSVLANDLYHQLTQEGFKVFFARITLEDKLGAAYEPYIFAALNSAKVMVVLGTRPEYFNAVWVKNEWSRYLALVKNSGGKKALIPAYKDMDPYDLPEEFSHLQAQDMSKLGFMQDLIRGIKKIAQPGESKTVPVKEAVASGGSAGTAPLLKRAFMFLEDGDWTSADEYCEKVLDMDPENAEAYLGKLMAELKTGRREALKDCKAPFDGSKNYQKAVRFGSAALKEELDGYIAGINERNENDRKTGIYNDAVKVMNSARTETEFKDVTNKFRSISGFRDADTLVEKCLERAESIRKDKIYAAAKSCEDGTVSGYKRAADIYQQIGGWKDADERRLAAEQKAEELRIAAEKAAKKRKKIIAITIPSVCVCIAFVILLTQVIIPRQKYNKAMSLIDAGDYDAGYALLEELGNTEAIAASKYDWAMELINAGEYETALKLLSDIGRQDEFTDEDRHNWAISLLAEEKYDEAYRLFDEIGEQENITQSKRDRAEVLLGQEEYEKAYSLLRQTGDTEAIAASKYDRAVECIAAQDYKTAWELLDGMEYKDSGEKQKSIKPQYYRALLTKAAVGDTVFFGSYEQDNETSNGKEDIEWLVLAKENNRLLVVSQYGLDCQQYNTSETEVTWENCTLREWLNEDFFHAAFSDGEKAMIPTVTVSADKNPDCDTEPGESTQDKVFLLSVTEANRYFKNGEERVCGSTAYAKANGVYAANDYTTESGVAACWWWLRSPGEYQGIPAAVDCAGGVSSSVNSNFISYIRFGVRPAMWIELSD